MAHGDLVDIGLDVLVPIRLNQVFRRDALIIDFGPVDPFPPHRLLRSLIEKIQDGVVSQLGDQMQGEALSHHLHHIVGAKMAI